eukprot:Gregarina_sp_Poly_1__4078@NODE_223_length_11242_cov_216_496107_g197_i0_p2_GENE_NODE_223_length_11242_cov_216_496107_g197_i0NODE_223_length_11242_cov_216_496107_g197_i0_p2_ORF_typecomplete_len672_score100_19MiaE_2/PF13794_6/0_12_NODE_223_length_11242_cov_216_496107_g197_i02682283
MVDFEVAIDVRGDPWKIAVRCESEVNTVGDLPLLINFLDSQSAAVRSGTGSSQSSLLSPPDSWHIYTGEAAGLKATVRREDSCLITVRLADLINRDSFIGNESFAQVHNCLISTMSLLGLLLQESIRLAAKFCTQSHPERSKNLTLSAVTFIGRGDTHPRIKTSLHEIASLWPLDSCNVFVWSPAVASLYAIKQDVSPSVSAAYLSTLDWEIATISKETATASSTDNIQLNVLPHGCPVDGDGYFVDNWNAVVQWGTQVVSHFPMSLLSEPSESSKAYLWEALLRPVASLWLEMFRAHQDSVVAVASPLHPELERRISKKFAGVELRPVSNLELFEGAFTASTLVASGRARIIPTMSFSDVKSYRMLRPPHLLWMLVPKKSGMKVTFHNSDVTYEVPGPAAKTLELYTDGTVKSLAYFAPALHTWGPLTIAGHPLNVCVGSEVKSTYARLLALVVRIDEHVEAVRGLITNSSPRGKLGQGAVSESRSLCELTPKRPSYHRRLPSSCSLPSLSNRISRQKVYVRYLMNVWPVSPSLQESFERLTKSPNRQIPRSSEKKLEANAIASTGALGDGDRDRNTDDSVTKDQEDASTLAALIRLEVAIKAEIRRFEAVSAALRTAEQSLTRAASQFRRREDLSEFFAHINKVRVSLSEIEAAQSEILSVCEIQPEVP